MLYWVCVWRLGLEFGGGGSLRGGLMTYDGDEFMANEFNDCTLGNGIYIPGVVVIVSSQLINYCSSDGLPVYR